MADELNEDIIPGVIYEYSPEEAEELGASEDPATSDLPLNEDSEELELIEKQLEELSKS